ncbi:4-(cytidine 5'-diphospho)-2-C-methyl-D-erythritol kinase [Lyngbya confervoides]|uniref:4-diphosphocytidyl-2-C-methyl-D-erythritol kinase n=1 Tax=Lyngbya confervoides BDU141951 TaxID=1574623 RepID=A0ABD4SZR6_9CYAN|nr:4-(cytidine 5'-diphospho)-2-C-methyl-D-erythritol kinase [Lyngbya confervoides]MCM1981951.1 4-(cytidine 5'-diphospho)-2-C-methyl-D-erythritol kinase [Lyngbya confervoides BDU141951]
MQSYTLLAPAKINLLLEVIGDRPDGYHELVMVMQSVDLADEVKITPLAGDRIIVRCDHPMVPTDSSNLAYKAARLMQQQYPGHGGVEIQIQKRIPIGAGLAGGSTDGAATLVGLDLMWNLGLTQAELEYYAAQLGSDVPFCVGGGTKLALGRGEELSPLADLDQCYAVLAKYDSLSVSTPWAYQTYRTRFADCYANSPEAQEVRRRQGPSVPLLKAMQAQDYVQIGQCLHNDLERAVLDELPRVARLKETFLKHQPLGCLMSGSGPTVFALTQTQAEAQALAQQVQAAIADADLQCWVTQFCRFGISVLEPV